MNKTLQIKKGELFPTNIFGKVKDNNEKKPIIEIKEKREPKMKIKDRIALDNRINLALLEECNSVYYSKHKIENLISQGADVNFMNHKGETPLINATFVGVYEICDLLIKHGANVDLSDFNSRTPLMLFFSSTTLTNNSFSNQGKEEIIDLLLDNGASINAKDYFGNTALDYALCRESEISAIKLIERGALNTLDEKEIREIFAYTFVHEMFDVTKLVWQKQNRKNRILNIPMIFSRTFRDIINIKEEF